MDLNVARTFLEIVRTGSFAAAADSLNLTQTAISARIRVLEAELQAPVFVRNKAGARLTPGGERFLRYATSLVQVWDRARHAVALPPGRDTVLVAGAELSLWDPLLRHWLSWMREACPDIAVRALVDTPDRLMAGVQNGSLDVAIVYGPPRRQGVVAELLFEEKLVLVRTPGLADPHALDRQVLVDWGEAFLDGYRAAHPDRPNAPVSISYGPLALDYILATGGSGYFRKGFVRPFLADGRLELVPDSPEFSYSAHMVHGTKAESGGLETIRQGFRRAAGRIEAA